MHSLVKLFRTMQQGVSRLFHRNAVAIVQPGHRRVLNERRVKVIKRLSPDFSQESIGVKWHTEFGHLNRGDMLTSEQH
ncbi:hypothetical protein ABL945_17930, partial [Escherichia albertii]|uniref:hypothetical protein n=1 Tax=Escherichia albertii TaxID=208962 RepID=UPI0032B74525